MDSAVAAARSQTTFAPTSTTGRVGNSCMAAQINEQMAAREVSPTSGEEKDTQIFLSLATSKRRFSRALAEATAHALTARHPLSGASRSCAIDRGSRYRR